MPPPLKRRRKEITTPLVEEITFDPSSRQEYLTGFHKRKVQRTKHAQEIAAKRARVEKIESRRKIRESRKAEIERHVEEVNAFLKNGLESEDEAIDGEKGTWEGIEDGDEVKQVEPIDHEAEYVDEEKYTTVTIEAMDVTKEGLMKAAESRNEPEAGEAQTSKEEEQTDQVNPTAKPRKWTKDKPKDPDKKKRKKKRNFKYENKADRKDARSKQRAKNSKQARERRAGG